MAPTVQSLIMDSIPRRQMGMVLGIYFFLGSEVAGIITPVYGYMIDNIGVEHSYSVLAIIAAVSGVIFFIIRGRLQVGAVPEMAQGAASRRGG